MENITALTILFSLIAGFIGMINPKLVIKWGDEEKRTRKKVIITYGVVFLISFMWVGSITESKKSVSTGTSTGEVTSQKEKDKTEDENKKNVEEEKKAKIIKDGTYKIGTDLPAGEYVFFAKGLGYYEVTADSTGEFGSIISNDNIRGHSYITVNDGEYLKLKYGEAYKLEEAPSVKPTDGIYRDGMYKVGSDIPEGEYKVVLKASSGYIEVNATSRGDFRSIISNDNITADSYITVKTGQYLKLNGVEINLK